MTEKEYQYECFGETLEFAESLGWVDNHPDGTSKDYDANMVGDAIEQEAIEFIEGKGYKVVGYDDD